MLTLQDEIKSELKYYVDRIIDTQITLDSAMQMDPEVVGLEFKQNLINSIRSILNKIEDQLYKHIALITKKEYITGNLI